MKTRHLEDQLLPYLSGELPAAERGGVDAHVVGCDACRAILRDFERLSADLAQTAPPPRDWSAYRAELHDKLARRGARPAPVWPAPARRAPARDDVVRFRPVPLALAAGLVAVLVYVGAPGFGGRGAGNGELAAAMEHAILVSRLDLIVRLDLVQRLDLLEDFEVIRRLDGLPGGKG